MSSNRYHLHIRIHQKCQKINSLFDSFLTRLLTVSRCSLFSLCSLVGRFVFRPNYFRTTSINLGAPSNSKFLNFVPPKLQFCEITVGRINLNLQTLITSWTSIEIQQNLSEIDRLKEDIKPICEDLENLITKNSNFKKTKQFLSK